MTEGPIPDGSGIADLGHALRVRQHRAARRRARRLLLVAAVVVVVAALAWLVLFSPVTSVRTVNVTGTSLLTPDAVRAAAQVPLGGPLARLDTASVATRVEALPEVADVSVRRSWLHTVTIVVTEKQAVLQSNGATGGYEWVDAQGAVFHTGSQRLKVPLLTTSGVPSSLLAGVAQVLDALPPDILKSLSTVSAATPDQITLYLTDGRQIVWGSAEQSDLKAQVIAVLLKQPGTIYDVSAPGHPAIR